MNDLPEGDVHELGPRTFKIYPSLQTITQTYFRLSYFDAEDVFTILGKRKESKIME